MKLDRKSIGIKLWLYFTAFAAVILILLWLLQIVFLQSLYEHMKTRDIADAAGAIANEYGSEDFEASIDRLTFRNSMLVILTDVQGEILYTSDEHGSGFPEGGDRLLERSRPGFARPLPREYPDFLQRLLQSGDDRISYTVASSQFQGKILIYGVRLPDAVLYISTPLDPVNATTDILRTQLVYVTVIALLLSLVIAVFIAKRFSAPVAAISRQAAKLAEGDFDARFSKGFCSEIDELAVTLDHTAKELSKVENLRRELIANISHDLRTPLTMIKAYTEMIRDISGDNKPKREEHLSVIATETDRLTTLVNDVLDLSAIQSGNGGTDLNNVNVSDMLLKILSRFEPLSKREGYHIQASVEPDQYAMADGKQLEQVLYNLIGNAINYIGEDNTIAIHLTDLGSRVRFEVKDSGEGIPPEELPLIWDRYYKSKTHKRSVVGTGLGLAIVKGILEAHDAEFGVDSRVGVGSTFWFIIKK